jgi:hypothetical protein
MELADHQRRIDEFFSPAAKTEGACAKDTKEAKK